MREEGLKVSHVFSVKELVLHDRVDDCERFVVGILQNTNALRSLRRMTCGEMIKCLDFNDLMAVSKDTLKDLELTGTLNPRIVSYNIFTQQHSADWLILSTIYLFAHDLQA